MQDITPNDLPDEYQGLSDEDEFSPGGHDPLDREIVMSVDIDLVLRDFQNWSGGFSPNECSTEQLRAYMDTRHQDPALLADIIRYLSEVS